MHELNQGILTLNHNRHLTRLTGLDLSQAELIRNYMLMGLEAKEQERIYITYWYPMERSFEQDNCTEYFDRFMRDF